MVLRSLSTPTTARLKVLEVSNSKLRQQIIELEKESNAVKSKLIAAEEAKVLIKNLKSNLCVAEKKLENSKVTVSQLVSFKFYYFLFHVFIQLFEKYF